MSAKPKPNAGDSRPVNLLHYLPRKERNEHHEEVVAELLKKLKASRCRQGVLSRQISKLKCQFYLDRQARIEELAPLLRQREDFEKSIEGLHEVINMKSDRIAELENHGLPVHLR